MNEQKFGNRQERVQFQTSSIWLLNADWFVLRLLVVFFFLIRQSMSPRLLIRRVPLRFRSGGDFDQSELDESLYFSYLFYTFNVYMM